MFRFPQQALLVLLVGVVGSCTPDGTTPTEVHLAAPQRAVVAPTNASVALLTGTSAQVTWEDVTGEESRYEVQRRSRIGAGAWSGYGLLDPAPADAESYDDEGLTPGVTYQYRVRACDDDSCSAAVLAGKVTAVGLPAAPGGAQATAEFGRIALGWTDGSIDEARFEVERRGHAPAGTFGEFAPVGTTRPNTTLFADGSLTPGDTYEYRVRACNAAGCSDCALTNEVTWPPVPGAPTGVTTTQLTLTSLRVRWTDGSTGETRFEVYRRSHVLGSPFGGWQEMAEPSPNVERFDEDELATGYTHQYRVRACTLSVCSAFANGPAVVPDVSPAAPTGLVATPISPLRIDLVWVDGSANETRFELYRAVRNPDGTLGTYERIAEPGANATAYTSRGLTPATGYRYRIRACNLGGCSSFATSPVVTTPN